MSLIETRGTLPMADHARGKRSAAPSTRQGPVPDRALRDDTVRKVLR